MLNAETPEGHSPAFGVSFMKHSQRGPSQKNKASGRRENRAETARTGSFPVGGWLVVPWAEIVLPHVPIRQCAGRAGQQHLAVEIVHHRAAFVIVITNDHLIA